MSETVEARNVSMYPSDWKIVEGLNEKEDFGSLSFALRRIVREWQRNRLQPRQMIDSPEPYKVEPANA